jgi:hypothetical protein
MLRETIFKFKLYSFHPFNYQSATGKNKKPHMLSIKAFTESIVVVRNGL